MAASQRHRTDRKFTVEEFLAWIERRPEEERWQLIDGVAMLMNPPTLRHQFIASNLAFELNAHFRKFKPDLQACQEVGLIVPEVELFRPESDVAVLDAMAPEGSYAERFYLAAEVLSDSNTDRDIEFKLASYKLHPDNLYCLVIDQHRIFAEVSARTTRWHSVQLDHAESQLNLPEFELSLRLGDLYRGTPLWVPTVGEV